MREFPVPGSAKQTPQSSYLTDFARKVRVSAISNLSRKSSKRLSPRSRGPEKRSGFGAAGRRRPRGEKEPRKCAIDLRFVDSDLDSNFSPKNSARAASNPNSSFQVGRVRGKNAGPSDSSRIHAQFVKNFPGHAAMSPTSKFQNKFFARKSS